MTDHNLSEGHAVKLALQQHAELRPRWIYFGVDRTQTRPEGWSVYFSTAEGHAVDIGDAMRDLVRCLPAELRAVLRVGDLPQREDDAAHVLSGPPGAGFLLAQHLQQHADVYAEAQGACS